MCTVVHCLVFRVSHVHRQKLLAPTDGSPPTEFIVERQLVLHALHMLGDITHCLGRRVVVQ